MTEFGTAATIGIALIATGRLWATLGDVEEINVVCGTRRPARVRAFIDFLTSSRAGSIYKSKGMEPG